MKLRRVAIGMALSVGLVMPLVIGGSAESATPNSARTVGLAAAGQWITFSGHVSGGARPVAVYWGTPSTGMFNPVRGKSNAAGNFALRYRMMAGPYVNYTVVAPASGRYARWTSAPVRVKGQEQDVTLTRSGSQFTAQLTWTDLSAMTIANAPVSGRGITLQQQVSPGNWTTVAGPVDTDSSGAASFAVRTPTAAYRAVAAQMSNGLSTYVSFPVWVTPPSLNTATVSDPPGRNISPMPNSNNGAAQKYNWWPNNLFWDMEQGEGMSAQGCTTHCTFWSDYSTGSGRVNVRDGQIALESFAAQHGPGWGFMSSTMQNPGYKTGRWEMRVHQSVYPNQKPGTSPYTVQISLVPAGTPDSTRTPSKQIVLAQWTGYRPATTISLRNGKRVESRQLAGVQYSQSDWHDVAVQITASRVTWLLDGNVVGHAAIGSAISGTHWVARIEMIDRNGYSMDRARGGIDWVRYFTLNRSWAKSLPAGSAF